MKLVFSLLFYFKFNTHSSKIFREYYVTKINFRYTFQIIQTLKYKISNSNINEFEYKI